MGVSGGYSFVVSWQGKAEQRVEELGDFGGGFLGLVVMLLPLRSMVTDFSAVQWQSREERRGEERNGFCLGTLEGFSGMFLSSTGSVRKGRAPAGT